LLPLFLSHYLTELGPAEKSDNKTPRIVLPRVSAKPPNANQCAGEWKSTCKTLETHPFLEGHGANLKLTRRRPPFRKEGLEKGKDELLKQKLHLQHNLGLGQTPNVIPPGEVDIGGEPRTVEIGWHPVAGFAGKWFAEQTGLGKIITEKIHKCPDPTQHWAVLVGDYVHQLWMVRQSHFPFPVAIFYLCRNLPVAR
jgi:hypothetical protein